MTKRYWIAVAAVAFAIVCALAWWMYRDAQKRELQQGVGALVQDSTARLREALGLLTAGPEAHARLEAHFTALKGNVEKTQALNASLNPALVQAADAYLTDVQALLRRQLALHAGRDAMLADIGEIGNHLGAAGTRSSEWIGQAVALNKRLEKSFFDYRLAAGGLEKSFGELENTSSRLRTLVPAAAVIERDLIVSAKGRLLELSAQTEQQVKNAKKLPVGG